jgi:hypothetical protein
MQTRNKKIAAALLGALLLAVGLLFVPSLLEKQTESSTAEFLKSLPGDIRAQSVKADFWNAEVILKGVTGTGKRMDGGEFTFEAGEVLTGDIKSGSLAASGPVPLLGRFQVKDLNIRANIALPGPAQPLMQTITVADLSLRDISGDLKRLMQAYNAGQGEFIDALATCRAGNVAMNGYAVTTALGALGSAHAALDSFTGRDMSLLGSGSCELRGFKISALGMDLASLGSMRWASVAGPNIYHYMVVMQQEMQQGRDGRAAIPDLVQALKTNPVVLRNMECEDISLPLNLPADKRLHIARTSMDVTLDAGGFKARTAFSGLSIPPDMLSGLIPFASEFARIYGKNLEIAAVMDLDGTLKGKEGALHLNVFSLADPALFSLESSGAFAFTVKEGGAEGLEGLLLSGAGMFLNNCRLTIEDINLINTVFAGSGDKAAARGAAAAMLRSPAEDESNRFLTKALNGLAQLVAAPGKLTVAVTPALPLPLTADITIEEGMRRLDAGTVVEYTPR